MLREGQKVKFDPFDGIKCSVFSEEPVVATGTIVHIYYEHKWFLVEYLSSGTALKTAFKFCDIGSVVTVCG